MTITSQTLKNAAFAIGHDLFTDPDGANYLVKDGAILRRWEPGTSSADSFELMARLDMKAESVDGGRFIEAELFRFRKLYRGCCNHTEDRANDYRMAILLCAARFGESL